MTASPEPIAMFEEDNAKVTTMSVGAQRFIFDGTEKAISELSKIAKAKTDGRYMIVIVYDKDEMDMLVKQQSKKPR